MQITIRQAKAEDAALLAELNTAVQQLHADAEPQRYKAPQPHDPALIAVYSRHLADAKTQIFIAEAEGEALGYILLQEQQTEENPFVYAQNRLYIDQMSVNASHRGKGVGHALMQRAKELGRECNVDYLVLGVRAFNEEAIKFYKREGFEASTFSMWQKMK
jgi:diamine N-acetyltransferase